MPDLKIRCSSLGHLMTEPKNKSEVLSVGAKTHIRNLVAQDIFGVDFEVSDKKLEKGNVCEPDSIALLNRVRGLALVKNTERKTNDWLSGEADLFDAASGVGYDIKTAWSAATFPICPEDVADAQRRLYDWQMRGYAWLWGADEWVVAYCLVDTPEELCKWEPLPLHMVSHLPEHHRLTTWTVRRDIATEAVIKVKVEAARQYYGEVAREFERTHQSADGLIAVPPWVAAGAAVPITPPPFSAAHTHKPAVAIVLPPTF